MPAKSLAEIYNSLASGETLTLKFLTKQDLVRFRTLLATYKYRTEKVSVELGVLTPQTLSINRDPTTGLAKVRFIERTATQPVTFEILDTENP